MSFVAGRAAPPFRESQGHDFARRHGTHFAECRSASSSISDMDPFQVPAWKRLIIGTAPFGFALELLLRAIVVYLFLTLAVRVLGKRMSGQVTNLELGVMMTLGAIVAVPVELPTRGIVTGLVLLVVIVGLQRGLGELETRSPRAAAALVGRMSPLVRDGVLVPAELERARISQQQLLSVLREQHVRHLGEVERVYLESYGMFSVLRRAKPQPGLSVLPVEPGSASASDRGERARVCSYCGLSAEPPQADGTRCENCGHTRWQAPVAEPPAAAG